MRPDLEGRRAREAARALNVYISSVRNRAMETGRPCGLILHRLANPNGTPSPIAAALSMDQCETPPTFAGLSTGAVVQVIDATFNGGATTGRTTAPSSRCACATAPAISGRTWSIRAISCNSTAKGRTTRSCRRTPTVGWRCRRSIRTIPSALRGQFGPDELRLFRGNRGFSEFNLGRQSLADVAAGSELSTANTMAEGRFQLATDGAAGRVQHSPSAGQRGRDAAATAGRRGGRPGLVGLHAPRLRCR